MKGSYSIKVAGAAGQGVKTIGKTLQRTLQAIGFYTFGYTEYPSLIRGGLNTYQIDFAFRPIFSSSTKIDVLLAINSVGLESQLDTLKKEGIIVSSKSVNEGINRKGKVEIPAEALLEDNRLPEVVQNSLFAGAVMKVLGFENNELKTILQSIFEDKGKRIVDQNVKAAQLGAEISRVLFSIRKPRRSAKNKELVSANEAIAKSFIKCGGGFFAAYPMTPATSILHYLASNCKSNQLVVKQAFTEIEAIGMAAGASFTGKRSMTATSGGGLALMSEFVSFLGMAEIPLVIVDAQRTGPATGLPTWTEQGDLDFSIFLGHGDFPKVVLAPGDAREAFEMLSDALNIADEFQIPVILLSDKQISESLLTVEDFSSIKVTVNRGQIAATKRLANLKRRFRRYRFSAKNGVSERSLPGSKGGIYLANSDEHNEFGYSTESSETRAKMQEKRMRKVTAIKKRVLKPNIFGRGKADLLIIGWGSTKGVILDAISEIDSDQKIKFCQIRTLWPFPEGEVRRIAARAKTIVLVENNYSAQLNKYLRLAGVEISKKITKYDGRPFFRDELAKLISNELEK